MCDVPEWPKHDLSVDVTPDDGGSVITKEGLVTETKRYEEGTKVELTAVPNEGWEFLYWRGDVVANQNPLTVYMDYSRTIVAHFVKIVSFKVFANPIEGGTVSPISQESDSTIQCKIGDNVTLTATPNMGYRFVRWEGWIEPEGPEAWREINILMTSTENPTIANINNDNWRFRAIFEPVMEPPEETMPPPTTTTTPPPAQAISAVLEATTSCQGFDPECQCFITVSFEGKDLTGDYPITHVVLTANGDVWHDSKDILTEDYWDVVQKEVVSGKRYTLVLTVTNINGQTVIATKDIVIPECPELRVEDVLRGEFAASTTCECNEHGCTGTLRISFSGIDLTGGDRKVARVILKVNEDVWSDSGPINDVRYDNVVSRSVSCGGVYFIELIVTNVTGQTVTVYQSVTVPTPTG